MTRSNLLLAGSSLALLVGCVILARGCVTPAPRGARPASAALPAARASPVTLTGGGRGSAVPMGRAGSILVPRTTPVTAAEREAIGELVVAHLGARASGDEAAVRAELASREIFDDMNSEDPQFDPATRPDWYHPLEMTPENVKNYEDALVSDILRETPEERQDFARKARVTDVVPLEDGRFLVRMYAESALATWQGRGREVDNSGVNYLPTERRMLVRPTSDGWKIVAFPRLDRQPPLPSDQAQTP